VGVFCKTKDIGRGAKKQVGSRQFTVD